MSMKERMILVFGANGQQGSATARHLLAKGWQVRAFVRRPEAATQLQRAGAEIVQGDLNDRASVVRAMQGIYGVFSVLPHNEQESEQGKNIAEAALEAGVRHFVYTSISNAEELFQNNVNTPKWEIEQHIWKLGLPATILRPAGFMDSMAHPLYGVVQGTLAIPLKPHTPYPMIAVSDIGMFATLAFEEPDQYLGKTLELAGDAPTPLQIVAAISQATGHEVTFTQLSLETIRQQSSELARAYELIEAGGFKGDSAALRQLHPDLMDFPTWLQKEGAEQLQAILA
ncbi:NmrA/HSCARG family protein [Thermosporothrix hazakensis]|jgi:uncharacterized protein YbjT (DUF2867 family)|nr:NmrA/HSCARG family protein [Thermosporothrix hazakensis]GCE50073.1 NmrA family transcriptional regulator [Thermosporothrix hazakensis]